MRKSYTTSITTKYGRLWAVLPDSIDMDNYLKIEEIIIPELEKSPKDVVLDFSRTKALFSSGIGLVVRLKKRVNELGQELSLVNIDPKIKEGLENVGLDKAFDMFSSEEDFQKSKDS
ncbi:MAG: STAS domain-containing protein [Chitinivibrionales bacterium]|nr:STAS domain-containing protein [Chitinivibrionales bacterium]MBD3395319.1 STAS domain-containing protein [Chitinivibrionales bacterium]